MSAASPTMIPVPTIALATPPPAWPAGTGFLTKKLQSRDEAPLETRYPRMRTRASTATNDSTATRAVMAPLTMRRRRRRALTAPGSRPPRSEEHTSELQSQSNIVCRLLLEKQKDKSQVSVYYPDHV